jgi:hypothetical protein
VAHHLARDRLGADGVDERLVDLQAVELEMVQVRQARVAGAEVVDRDLDAGGAQLADVAAAPSMFMNTRSVASTCRLLPEIPMRSIIARSRSTI